MKNFLTLALACTLTAGFTTSLLADDKAVPAGQSEKQTDKQGEKQNGEKGGKRRERGAEKAAAAKSGAKVGEAAPNFTLKTTDGKEWSLSDAKGKVVVLEWINPECPVCVRVMEQGVVADTMKGVKEQFPDAVYVAINSSAARQSSLDATAEYLKSHKIDIPALLDSDGKVGTEYGARTTPHCFVIDANGVLVYAGAIDDGANGDAKTNYVVNAAKQMKAGEKVSPSETKSYGCSVKYKR
jgi:peroxiredoxin